ncbi:HNH endonuclease [Picosynechococcus sp. PCC 7003]|uniref:HNH endonuclease n=1 Tax=Picosynechococcus sp. PCC 7003 TaxID=374981 RepID=UPI0009035E8B|nr:HNH endonuclease signature motif containing protein [Picosynechococcus sp. PCC 7003]
MQLDSYLQSLPTKRKLSDVKSKILTRLWGDTSDAFPKPWVSSDELLELTGQKYFDRRTRELRDELGCDIESSYIEQFNGHGWRLKSSSLSPPQDRGYLTQRQKNKLFEDHNYTCVTCGIQISAGIKGLQADHKVPLSRGGSNELTNWQPMCNNCNVGKRRACEGCELECETCSWAYPEKFGVITVVSISEKTLRRIDEYSIRNKTTRDKVMEDASNYYLDDKNKD